MTDAKPVARGSLLERAATVYDFGAAFRARGGDAAPAPLVADPVPQAAAPVRPAPSRTARSPVAVIDRLHLREAGLLVPGAAVDALAEEFRLIKRQLLLTARAIAPSQGDRSRAILVGSANANEGKTYCAINLALSIAAERDTEVVLIDADVAKPGVLAALGLEDRPGLLDALADPNAAVEDYLVPTDVPHLTLLPAGSRSNQDTELLASRRTPELLGALLASDPRRIVIFDTPPALAASPAATLALHVGQVLLVVRADATSDTDLRAAVSLLNGCEHIQLALNAVTLVPGGRRFGSYYGMEDA
jgi:protein-tyrosine kinase